MKPKSLSFIVILFSSLTVLAQVTAGQIDDFEDETVQGWFEGILSPNPPINITTDGPSGVNDHYLQDDSAGGTGSGSKMVIRNTTQWAGNYTSEGIIAIRFNARVITEDLDNRIAMTGGGGAIGSKNAVTVIAGSGWTSIVIPIAFGDMQTVTANGAVAGFDIAATLSNCTEFRILSNNIPSYNGESIASRIEIDNVEALTTLNLNKFKTSAFSIFPNPSSSILNLELTNITNNSKLEVFDVLGKKVYTQKLNIISNPINVIGWNSGIYLVKVSNEFSVQTKRFIKQ